MKDYLGAEGTEQFSIETIVDGKTHSVQPIHDPFVSSTVITTLTRFEHFKRLFRNKPTKTQIVVRATEGAQRAIMTLDPYQLQRDSEEILEQRRAARETSPTTGLYYSEQPPK